MARLVTGGTYDEEAGELMVGGSRRAYVATDNLRSPALVGRRPAEVIDAVERLGLGFDAATGTGVTLHLLGALPRYGKMGAVCIGRTPEEAEAIDRRLHAAVEQLPPEGSEPAAPPRSPPASGDG